MARVKKVIKDLFRPCITIYLLPPLFIKRDEVNFSAPYLLFASRGQMMEIYASYCLKALVAVSCVITFFSTSSRKATLRTSFVFGERDIAIMSNLLMAVIPLRISNPRCGEFRTMQQATADIMEVRSSG